MRGFVLVAVVLVLAGCRRASEVDPPGKPDIGAKPPAAKPKTDLERLEGSWRAVKSEMNGRPLGVNAIWTFKNGKVKLQEGFGALNEEEGTFALNAVAQPKTLDLKMEEMSYRCIYQFDGEDLTVCFDETGVLPMDFSSKGPTRVLHLFKRES